MYAYVDETGNTGRNIFDKAQPRFMTAALITKVEFDDIYKTVIRQIGSKIGSPILHANQLGVAKIEVVAKEIRNILEGCDAQFFISRIDKMYLAAAKLVDTLFDSYENKAVPWHVYNLRPMRLLLVLKVAYILDESIIEKFWNSIIETNELKASSLFKDAISELKNNVNELPDKRSRQLITEAVDWAIENPDSIYLHVNSKAIRKGHLPNMVVFPNLLAGIDKQANKWNCKVKAIIHDRQSEFQVMLKEWHQLLSGAAPDVISWPGEEPIKIQCVANSKFIISSGSKSVGIQIIDIILWLFKRILESEPIGKESMNLMSYVFEHGFQHDLSFESLQYWLAEYFDELFSKPMTEQDWERGRRIMAISEEKRQEIMDEYAKQKIKKLDGDN